MSYKYAIIRVDVLTVTENEECNKKLAEIGCTDVIKWKYDTDTVINSYGDVFVFDKPVSKEIIQKDNYQMLNEYERDDKQAFWLEQLGDEGSEIKLFNKHGSKEYFKIKITEHDRYKSGIKVELIVPNGYAGCAVIPGFELRKLTVKDEKGNILKEYNSNIKTCGSYIRPFLVNTLD